MNIVEVYQELILVCIKKSPNQFQKSAYYDLEVNERAFLVNNRLVALYLRLF